MAGQIQEGATVQLKSGGPVMTVTKSLPDRIVCTWFDDGGKRADGAFPAAALKLIDEA